MRPSVWHRLRPETSGLGHGGASAGQGRTWLGPSWHGTEGQPGPLAESCESCLVACLGAPAVALDPPISGEPMVLPLTHPIRAVVGPSCGMTVAAQVPSGTEPASGAFPGLQGDSSPPRTSQPHGQGFRGLGIPEPLPTQNTESTGCTLKTAPGSEPLRIRGLPSTRGRGLPRADAGWAMSRSTHPRGWGGRRRE